MIRSRADVDFLSVAFTLDDQRLLAGTGDGRVFIWDLPTHGLVGTPIAAHGTNDVWELVMDPTGGRVATASSDGTVRVWSLADGQLVAEPFVDALGARTLESAAGVNWSAEGASLYAGGSDGRVHEWNFSSSSEVEVSTVGHDDRVIDSLASTDRRVLVTLGRDQDVRVWDLGEPPPVVTARADVGGALFGLAASADGAIVAVGDGAGTVHVLRGDGGDLQLNGHDGRVFGVAFLPGGRVVTGDDGGTLRVWDRETGRMEAASDTTGSPITSIAVAADGKRVATSSEDGVVRVYAVDDVSAPTAATDPAPAVASKVVFTASGGLVAAYQRRSGAVLGQRRQARASCARRSTTTATLCSASRSHPTSARSWPRRPPTGSPCGTSTPGSDTRSSTGNPPIRSTSRSCPAATCSSARIARARLRCGTPLPG